MMLRWREWSILDVYKLVLGVFLFLAPWLFGFGYQPARLDMWVTGALVATASVAALIAFAEWEEWVLVVIALWLVTSPWVLAFPHAAATKVDIGVGLVVAYLAALELWLVRYKFAHGMNS